MAETNSIAKQFPLNYKQIKQESTYQCRRHRRCRFEPGSGGNGNPLMFLLEKPHGQRSLMGYSPWGCKEADMTQQAPMHRNLAPGPVYLQIMLFYFLLIAEKRGAGEWERIIKYMETSLAVQQLRL